MGFFDKKKEPFLMVLGGFGVTLRCWEGDYDVNWGGKWNCTVLIGYYIKAYRKNKNRN